MYHSSLGPQPAPSPLLSHYLIDVSHPSSPFLMSILYPPYLILYLPPPVLSSPLSFLPLSLVSFPSSLQVFSFRFITIFTSLYYYAFCKSDREGAYVRISVTVFSLITVGQWWGALIDICFPSIVHRILTYRMKVKSTHSAVLFITLALPLPRPLLRVV
jgi:hypothetical protein